MGRFPNFVRGLPKTYPHYIQFCWTITWKKPNKEFCINPLKNKINLLVSRTTTFMKAKLNGQTNMDKYRNGLTWIILEYEVKFYYSKN